MTPKEVSDALDAKYNNTKKLMFTMLGDGQLLKDGKGRYSPANPTGPGNPSNSGNLGNSGNPGNPSGSGNFGGNPGNPSGNPDNREKADTYEDKESRVTGVTVECIHGVVGGCWICKKSGGAA
jgi:hypothetical protein